MKWCALAFVVSIVSLALSIFNLVQLLGWEVELGPLGTWFGAIISAAAVIVALWVALDGRSERTKQQSKAIEESKERALRRASRIAISIQPKNRDPDLRHHWEIYVINGDDRPIFDIVFHPGLTLATSGKSVRTTAVAPETNQAVSLKPDGKHTTEVAVDHVDPVSSRNPDRNEAFLYRYLPALEFVDDDGYRFCWDNSAQGLTSGGRASGAWALKDDSRSGYPEDQPIVGKFYAISKLRTDEQEDAISSLADMTA